MSLNGEKPPASRNGKEKSARSRRAGMPINPAGGPSDAGRYARHGTVFNQRARKRRGES